MIKLQFKGMMAGVEQKEDRDRNKRWNWRRSVRCNGGAKLNEKVNDGEEGRLLRSGRSWFGTKEDARQRECHIRIGIEDDTGK